jgi:3-keto-disaccharide hydrolase
VILSRRELLRTAATLGMLGLVEPGRAVGAPAEIRLPDGLRAERFDFEARGLEGWTTVAGRWAVEEVADAPSGHHVLVQRATANEFNVLVAPAGPYSDVEASVRFKPISGRQDASGGIVFRFDAGRYYVVRANALEDNFRFYYYDGQRRQLATVRVKAPALGQWHALRVVALGDHMQASLNGTLLLDHRDTRFRSGRVGLWTKADSITAFDDLTIRGVTSTR